jgi:hypothetical protein
MRSSGSSATARCGNRLRFEFVDLCDGLEQIALGPLERDDLGRLPLLGLLRLVAPLVGAVDRLALALGTLPHDPVVVLDPLLALPLKLGIVLALGTHIKLRPDVQPLLLIRAAVDGEVQAGLAIRPVDVIFPELPQLYEVAGRRSDAGNRDLLVSPHDRVPVSNVPESFRPEFPMGQDAMGMQISRITANVQGDISSDLVSIDQGPNKADDQFPTLLRVQFFGQRDLELGCNPAITPLLECLGCIPEFTAIFRPERRALGRQTSSNSCPDRG